MGLYYDRRGKPMGLFDWAAKFDDRSYRIVAQEQVAPGIEVSTVWLGVNHNYGDGPPLIFETMIFGGEYDQLGWRWSTAGQAIQGHRRIVERMKAGLCPEADE